MGEFLAGSSWLRPSFMRWLSVGEWETDTLMTKHVSVELEHVGFKV